MVGDKLYGGDCLKINLNGQALQAYRLSFISPATKEKMTVEIDPDDDIKKLLRILRKGDSE